MKQRKRVEVPSGLILFILGAIAFLLTKRWELFFLGGFAIAMLWIVDLQKQIYELKREKQNEC